MAAAMGAGGDLSWAEPQKANADDDWGTFTTAKKKKGKKGEGS